MIMYSLIRSEGWGAGGNDERVLSYVEYGKEGKKRGIEVYGCIKALKIKPKLEGGRAERSGVWMTDSWSRVLSKPTAEHIQIYSCISQRSEHLSFNLPRFVRAIPDQTSRSE